MFKPEQSGNSGGNGLLYSELFAECGYSRSLKARIEGKGEGGRGGGVLNVKSRHVDIDGSILVNGGHANGEYQDAAGTLSTFAECIIVIVLIETCYQ